METKGVTCKIPLDLHNQISEEIRETESTMSKFIEMIIREHYEKGAILSLLTGLGNKHLLPAASLFFLEKSRPAEFPACGRSTIPISTRWGRCRKSPGTQALLCGKISASWISG